MYKPGEYRSYQTKLLRREAGYQCFGCGIIIPPEQKKELGLGIEIHHKRARRDGGENTRENAVPLCGNSRGHRRDTCHDIANRLQRCGIDMDQVAAVLGPFPFRRDVLLDRPDPNPAARVLRRLIRGR